MRRSELLIALLLPSLLGATPMFESARDAAGELWPATPPRTRLRLLYEGGTGGVSAPLANVDVDARVAEALGPDFNRVGGGFGALVNEGGWLLSTEGGVRRFAALGGAPLELGPAQSSTMLLAEDWAIVVWPPEAAAALMPALAGHLEALPRAPLPTQKAVQVRPGADGLLHVAANGVGPDGIFEPRDWETRPRLVHAGFVGGQPAHVLVVARLRGEGTRRARLVRQRTDPGTFLIAAGDAIEGRSFLPGMTLSLQRDVTWQAWLDLGLDILVPATNELLAGVADLQREADVAGVQLVSSNLRDPDGGHVFLPWTVLERGGRRLLVLGWTPPQALAALPPAIRNGLRTLGEEAIDEVLSEALASMVQPPDLVVLAGLSSTGLGGRLKGIDVVLTDFSADARISRTVRADLDHLAARQSMQRTARDAAIIGHLGPALLGRVDIEFGADGELFELSHTAEPIREDLPPDPLFRRAVQDVRQTIYADREDILIPSPDALVAPPGWRRSPLPEAIDDAAFAALAGNLLADRTGADVALLRPLPSPLRLPGPRPALLVDASLTVLDEVVVVELTGMELRLLLKAIAVAEPKPGTRPTADGWIVGGSTVGLVRGRKLADGDLVRVATTDFFLLDPRIASVFSKARVQSLFSKKGWQRAAVPTGAPWPLRELVREGLETLRDEDPSFGAAYSRRLVPLLTRDATSVGPRFALSIDDLALGVTGSVGFRPDTGYESSNESRANLKNSLATELRGRLGLSWSDRIGEVLGFVQGSFARSEEEEAEEPIELADDLLVGAEARVRVGAIQGPSGARFPLSAFLQGAFDTEFTAPDDPEVTDGKLPRQQLVRTTGGLTLGRMGWLKEAWLGFFVEADLVAEQGTFSPGFSAGLKTEKRWGPVKWANLVDFRGHLPTPEDTEADLSIRLGLRSELSVLPLRRIIPGLSIGAFVDALVYRGQIDGVNTTPGMHTLLGAQIRYDSELRAPLRLR